MITTEHDQHCVKSFRIRRFSAPYFPEFGLNTERNSVSLHIQSKWREIRTRITLNTFKVDSPTHLIDRKQVACMRQDP